MRPAATYRPRESVAIIFNFIRRSYYFANKNVIMLNVERVPRCELSPLEDVKRRYPSRKYYYYGFRAIRWVIYGIAGINLTNMEILKMRGAGARCLSEGVCVLDENSILLIGFYARVDKINIIDA